MYLEGMFYSSLTSESLWEQSLPVLTTTFLLFGSHKILVSPPPYLRVLISLETTNARQLVEKRENSVLHLSVLLLNRPEVLFIDKL